MSSTVATIESNSKGTCSNESTLIPSAPPADNNIFMKLDDRKKEGSPATNPQQVEVLNQSDNHAQPQTYCGEGVDSHLLNETLVLEPEATGKNFTFIIKINVHRYSEGLSFN